MKTLTEAQYEEWQALREFRYRVVLLGFKAVMWAFIGGLLLLICWVTK